MSSSIGIQPIFGRPGIGTTLTAQRRNIFKSTADAYLPGGKVIDGTASRDPGNSDGDVTILRAGLVMGKITSSGYYANSILGLSVGAVAAAATSLTVPAATATEIVRRIGTSGTFKLTGPPTAAGTVATQTVTYSAVNTTTGVITCTALSAASVDKSLVQPTDGSETPLTFIDDGYGVPLPADGTNVNFPLIPVSGVVVSSQLIDYPADASLKTWLKDALSTFVGGKYVFDDTF